MNKQEAIEAIKNIDTLNINDMITGQSVDMVIKNQVIDLISKIHEPQKVVVPKFVAEWIEETKEEGYNLGYAMSDAITPLEVEEWLFKNVYSNEEAFAKAWIFGYEVEQERLYTVEVPNPNNRFNVVFLAKEKGKVCIGTGTFFGNTPDDKWKKDPNTHLTESEIKQDFEWAWQWAELVEVE